LEPLWRTYTNEYLIKASKLSDDYVLHEKARQLAEIRHRTALYPKKRDYTLRDRIVILTDDGIATGATIIASARWIRRQRSNYLVIAVPVAPPQTVVVLRNEVDAVDVILSPDALNSVGQFYENFEPIIDDEVRKILDRIHLWISDDTIGLAKLVKDVKSPPSRDCCIKRRSLPCNIILCSVAFILWCG
jgi:putative phosphoribosyl transferase